MVTLSSDAAIELLPKCDFDPSWQSLVRHIWSWVDSTISVFIPFILIIVCNARLLYLLLQSPYYAWLKSSMTCTIMAVCLAFVLLKAPLTINYLLQCTALDSSYPTLLLSYTIVNLLCYTNNAVNFPVYFITSSRFRTAFKAMLCHNTIRPQTPLVQTIPRWSSANAFNLGMLRLVSAMHVVICMWSCGKLFL